MFKGEGLFGDSETKNGNELNIKKLRITNCRRQNSCLFQSTAKELNLGLQTSTPSKRPSRTSGFVL